MRGRLIVGLLVLGGIGILILSSAIAGPTDVEPGYEEAEKILDCAPEEGIFSYMAVWGDGAGFTSPEEALKGILVGRDFGVTEDDFVAKDVVIGDTEVSEFTVQSGSSDRIVVWAVPVEKGWLADALYGCTLTVE